MKINTFKRKFRKLTLVQKRASLTMLKAASSQSFVDSVPIDQRDEAMNAFKELKAWAEKTTDKHAETERLNCFYLPAINS